jgi:predicted lysophospholipase L1 biosynthesis ABC-type transport system permease subunit
MNHLPPIGQLPASRGPIHVTRRLVGNSAARLVVMVVVVAAGVTLVGSMRLGILIAERLVEGAAVVEKTGIAAGLDTLNLLCSAAVLLITFDVLSVMFADGAVQVGTLRVIGLQTDMLRRAMVREGALVGMAGAAIGIAVGIAGPRLLLPVTSHLSTADAVLAMRPHALLVGGALGVTAAVLAAARSIRHATRAPLAELMRRGRGADPHRRARRALTLGVALACAVFSFAMAERSSAPDHAALLRLLGLGTLAIPLLGVVATVFAAGLERRHERRTARAVGAARMRLVRAICVEVLLVGSLSFALAITLGAGLATIRPAIDIAPRPAFAGSDAAVGGGG